MPDKMKFETPDLTAENIKKLSELFPGVVTEGKVNVDLLRSYVGEEIFKDEAYEFTWVGKRAAIAEAGRPIRKTLRPVVEDESTPTGADSTGKPYCSSGSRDWDTTENLYIEGDNLDVLKLLQESYLGKVKMVYIDPPYNTGHDFIYHDNFRSDDEEYNEQVEMFDDIGNRQFGENTVNNPRIHSDWCSMIYPRLVLARNLLTTDGVIFISIDDGEVSQLRKLCDEVFGESNFLGIFVVNSTPNARDYGHIGKMHEFVLFYAKDIWSTQTNLLPVVDKTFKYSDERGGYNIHPLYNSNEAFTKNNRPNLFYPFYLYKDKPVGKDFFEIGLEKRDNAIEIYPPKSVKNSVQFVWRWGKEKAQTNLNAEIIGYKTGEGEYRIVQKMRHGEKLIRSLLIDTCYSSRRGTAEVEEIMEGKIFDFPKPFTLLSNLVKVGANKNEIVLDFFSGSATTAQAVMQLNAEDGGKRKFIMVQLPEVCAEGTEAAKAGYTNICEIGKERIRRAGDKIKAEAGLTAAGLDIGFRVLKLDDTNMNDVYYAAGDYTQDMLSMMESNIKPDRNDMDLLFGCLLDWGLPLSMPHTNERIDGSTVHTYNGGDLIACFEERISEKAIREIASRQPLRAVFRDSSFSSSPGKINVFEIFKLLAPNTTVRVI